MVLLMGVVLYGYSLTMKRRLGFRFSGNGRDRTHTRDTSGGVYVCLLGDDVSLGSCRCAASARAVTATAGVVRSPVGVVAGVSGFAGLFVVVSILSVLLILLLLFIVSLLAILMLVFMLMFILMLICMCTIVFGDLAHAVDAHLNGLLEKHGAGAATKTIPSVFADLVTCEVSECIVWAKASNFTGAGLRSRLSDIMTHHWFKDPRLVCM